MPTPTTFINVTHPYLKILHPPTGDYIEFVGGKLEMEESDPRYATVMAEVERSNGRIKVVTGAVYCPECSEPFMGGAARLELGKHRKTQHFEAWRADQEAKQAREMNAIVVERSGVPCDACPPALHSVFPDEEALALHVRFVHAKAPVLDAEGNTREADLDNPDGGAREPSRTSIAAATPTGG